MAPMTDCAPPRAGRSAGTHALWQALAALALLLALLAPASAAPAETFDYGQLVVGSGPRSNGDTIFFPCDVDIHGAIHTVTTGPGSSAFQVLFSEVLADGEAELDVQFSPGAIGTYTATVTVEVGGCTTDVDLIGEVIPATIPCPANIQVGNDWGRCGATVNYPAPTSDSGYNAVTCTPPSGSFFPGGTTTVTCHSQYASCSFTVTVTDTENPTISGPAAVMVSADPGQCSASKANVNLGTPTTGDNCGVRSVTNDAPASFPPGPTTVTWTVTDNAGNQATSTQTVTVIDHQNPTITAPAAVTMTTDPGQCTASHVVLGTPTTSDNCGVASVRNDAPATFPLGITTVTWTVMDAQGNRATRTQQVTVQDGEPPRFTNAPPAGATAIATCLPGGIGAVVSYTPLGAIDTCSVPTVGYDAGHAPGAAFPLGNTAGLATATDASGNRATCPFTVTVAYAWSGVLQPVNADGSSVFKAGSTVPVKFALTGASACVTTAVATLADAKVSNGVAGAVNEAVAPEAATDGNLFRYTGGQYQFNWQTKGLSAGTYELRIDLGDSVVRTVRLGLK